MYFRWYSDVGWCNLFVYLGWFVVVWFGVDIWGVGFDVGFFVWCSVIFGISGKFGVVLGGCGVFGWVFWISIGGCDVWVVGWVVIYGGIICFSVG